MKISYKHIIILSAIVVVSVLFYISIIDCESANRTTKNFLEFLNLIVTPVCLILGVIVGYPLIKKKLVENYVSRQFEIMHEANRTLRKECLNMMDKYPNKGISNQLKREEIEDCILDIAVLSDLTFDANPNAHRYAKLVETSLNEFYKYYPENGNHNYYRESLHSFIHTHVKQIYNYAKSLGTSFDSNIVSKRRLIKSLDKFVHDNQYTDIDSIDCSIDYYHTSQLLVIFFANSIFNIPHDNPLYHYTDYKSAPSPSPLARILFAKGIYIPLIIKSCEPLIFGFEMKLHLVGFTARNSKKTNGEEHHFYICHYANIGLFGFVRGTITNVSAMAHYSDDYINDGNLSDYRISNFKISEEAEIVTFEIEADLLHKIFLSKKRLLIKKMKEELNHRK